MRSKNLFLNAFFINILLSINSIYAYEKETATLTDIQMINEEGFGKFSNRYAWSIEKFRGSLYVGTNNAITPKIGLALFFVGLPFRTEGVDIWKGDLNRDGSWSWQRVITSGFQNRFNYGVRKMLVVGEYLYAVTGNHVKGFEVWRTRDGVNWTVEMNGGFGTNFNTSGRGLLAYNGYLYVGVENRVKGAQLWRRQITPSGDWDIDSEWQLVIKGGLGHNYWFSDIVEFRGVLYMGTLKPGGMQVYKSIDGINFEKVFDGHDVEENSIGAMKLYVYKDVLYIGTMNLRRGSALLSSVNGVDFKNVFTRGFITKNNGYTWYLKEYGGRLYVGTFNYREGFHLYSTTDAVDWTIETTDGLGESDYYGIRTMEIMDDMLILGTASATKSTRLYSARLKDR